MERMDLLATKYESISNSIKELAEFIMSDPSSNHEDLEEASKLINSASSYLYEAERIRRNIKIGI